MEFLIDYLKRVRHDSFSKRPFNEVDAALFAVVGLLDVKRIVPKIGKDGIRFNELIDKQLKLHGLNPLGLLISQAIVRALKYIKGTDRYKDVLVLDGYSEISIEKETQSTMLSLKIDDDTRIVVFSGTDDTIIGWKEDFNMLYKEEVPCLKNSLKYLSKIDIKEKNLYLVGHSKGGFMSLYAAAFTSRPIQEKIIKAYSFDGPGYHENIINSSNFMHMEHKMKLICPNGGVVGRVLLNPIKPKIVYSKFRGLNQHDILSWEIEGDEFKEYSEGYNVQSNSIKKKVDRWMDTLSEEEKVQFVEHIFKVFFAGGNKTLTELRNKPFRAVVAYLKLSKKEKKIVNSLFGVLAKDRIITREIFYGFMTIIFTK